MTKTKNWKKRFKSILKTLHKEDIFYLESYLLDFVEGEMEKARAEAKIEVLEEVAKNSGPGDSRHGDFYYLFGEILETLFKLRKKKS